MATNNCDPPPLNPDDGASVHPECLFQGHDWCVWRYEFTLPNEFGVGYRIGDAYHPVRTDFSQSGRFLFSSEYKTLTFTPKPLKYDNSLGLRLHKLHATNPFQLFVRVAGLIDTQALDKSHPRLERWRTRSRRPYNDEPFSPDMHQAAEKCFLESHLARMRDQAGPQLGAEVPSLVGLGGSDVLDMWSRAGTEPWKLDSPVGEGLLRLTWRMHRIFHLGMRDIDAGSLEGHSTATAGTYVTNFPGAAVVFPDRITEQNGIQPRNALSKPLNLDLMLPSSAIDEEARVFLVSNRPGGTLGKPMSSTEQARIHPGSDPVQRPLTVLSGGERVGAFASQIEPRVMELGATGLGMCPEVSVVARINAWFARNIRLLCKYPDASALVLTRNTQQWSYEWVFGERTGTVKGMLH